MTSSDVARMSSFHNPRAQHLAAIVPFYEGFYRARLGLDGIFVHDSSTISYLLAPQLYTWGEYPIRVDTGNSVCRGKTQPAVHVSDHETAWHGRRPVRILTGVDNRAVVELELERLAR
jgi:inosine-uridine nucleoside N-ribohydrolase